MSSLLIFHYGRPIEVQYTQLKANGEERYVIKAAETGAVIRLNKTNTWEAVGKSAFDSELLQKIGAAISKQENNWYMTLYEFKLLDEPEQIEALSNIGVLLGERKSETHRYMLYQIDGFYIELKYSLTDNSRQGIRTFTTTTLLEPYLGAIDIPNLKK